MTPPTVSTADLTPTLSYDPDGRRRLTYTLPPPRVIYIHPDGSRHATPPPPPPPTVIRLAMPAPAPLVLYPRQRRPVVTLAAPPTAVATARGRIDIEVPVRLDGPARLDIPVRVRVNLPGPRAGRRMVRESEDVWREEYIDIDPEGTE